MVDVDELVSARLIAYRLGWKSVQSVHYYWRTDPKFPAPVFSLTNDTGGLRLWCWPDVEAWADAKGSWPVRPGSGAGGTGSAVPADR